ncbi:amidase [Halalkalibacter nanhaiisediminis]|uniref:Amidase n=1 Tax=Halalkalibacter nanhaiisediminis TaxID=688079 RepID=A0A562QCN9_9BACI|nr:amidase [Halalkalibacter nanhaiisediminis]TWI54525.1 amidase [Halalkalibacter nanhaiisediminis]
MKDYNAFVEELNVEPFAKESLSGLRFAVKDVLDVKGITASAGNPDWLRTHSPAKSHAPVVQRLLENGATLVGTTITDELMYSLNGENIHYGTPVNPKDHQRIPGGSSSGSAVAVAAKLVDFALGTDTAGSVRIPAAYCGLYGFRPTHNFLSIEGVIPLAPSFDTVGWMTCDTKTLLKVGEVLLQEESSAQAFTRVMVDKDAWALADEESKQALSPVLTTIENCFTQRESIEIADEGLVTWMNAFRTLQGIEVWKSHGEWIETVKPHFGPDIAARFEWASTLKEDESATEQQLKERIQNRLEKLLGDDGLLIIPTVPGKAPLVNMSGEEIEKRRSETIQLSSIAGLAGLPQVTIPVADVEGVPIGLSVIAGPKQDLRLLRWMDQHCDLWEK